MGEVGSARRASGLLERLLSELDDIREVINLYPKQRKSARQPQQTMLTRLSEPQQGCSRFWASNGKNIMS